MTLCNTIVRNENSMKELKQGREKESNGTDVRNGNVDDDEEEDARFLKRSGESGSEEWFSSVRMFSRQASLTDTERFVLESLLMDGEEGDFRSCRSSNTTIDTSGRSLSKGEAKKSSLKSSIARWEDRLGGFFQRLFPHNDTPLGPRRLSVAVRNDSLFAESLSEVENVKEGADRKKEDGNDPVEPPLKFPPPLKRDQSGHIGLWRAHSQGVPPVVLVRRFSKSLPPPPPEQLSHLESGNSLMEDKDDPQYLSTPPSSPQAPTPKPEKEPTNKNATPEKTEPEQPEEKGTEKPEGNNDFDDDYSVRSDEEVRDTTKNAKGDADGENDSLEDDKEDQYDTWTVLRDEYAVDFGFRVASESSVLADKAREGADGKKGIFQILGTHVEDTKAMPHVMSPPLMDAVRNFVPDTLGDQNFWLKYSLVRDGASLETLKRYTRAAPNTILAIETTAGHVFGSFTCEAWQNHYGYFGTGQSFLWKMRHNRVTTVCHSLYEQAAIESDIVVYPYSNRNDYIQLCTSDKIAVGGGELVAEVSETSNCVDDVSQAMNLIYAPVIPKSTTQDAQKDSSDDKEGSADQKKKKLGHLGFGIALSSDLLHGTTSGCGTFRSPCLTDPTLDGDIFEVVNVEVWTFTPCDTEYAAERMEMMKYFVERSVAESMGDKRRLEEGDRNQTAFTSRDLLQEEFYRRLGEGKVEDDIERDAWNYGQMMAGNIGVSAPHAIMRP